MGEATPAQLGSFVTALRVKGETAEEMAGMATIMREKALHVEVDGLTVDTAGTGGDAKGTFNISTAAALVGGWRRSQDGQARWPGLLRGPVAVPTSWRPPE